MATTDRRKYILRVRLTKEERRYLQGLAQKRGVDMSGWIRLQIHDAVDTQKRTT